MTFLLLLVLLLLLVVGCLHWMPQYRERPGTNREALGTTDTIDEEDAPIIVSEDSLGTM